MGACEEWCQGTKQTKHVFLLFFLQVAEGYSHEDKCNRLELQVLLHIQTLGVEELLNSCQPVFKWWMGTTFLLLGWEVGFFFFLSPEHPYHNLLNPQCALREPLGFMETVLQPDPCTQWNDPGVEFCFTGTLAVISSAVSPMWLICWFFPNTSQTSF